MTKRENLLSLLRRTGFSEVPIDVVLCPHLLEVYKEKTGGEVNYEDYFGLPWRNIQDLILPPSNPEIYLPYYDHLKEGTIIDMWGVAREPGSEAAASHMSHMRSPLRNIQTIEEIIAYPFPDVEGAKYNHQKHEVENIHKQGLAAVGNLQLTVWEASWYMRSMEELMMDMMTDDPKAEYLLDKITNLNLIRAKAYVNAGVDILYLGDDIGMQKSTMMSDELYVTWLKPRLKKIILEAKKINPEVIICYHSCGYITPFIHHLIEVGVDVLNPIQPECMDFKEIYSDFGTELSFFGTIGTQSTMPFGTTEDVRREVYNNLEIAGDLGGLFVAPTHVLEPDVPWENIMAYVKACKDFK